MTFSDRVMSLSYSRRNEEQSNAVVKSPTVERSLPRYGYIQWLIEDFRQSSSPECERHVIFSPDKIFRDYVSATYHLPGAYVDFFPCAHCTHKDEERRTSLVEVFHFANVHTPNLCATVTFVIPADPLGLMEHTGCRVEVDFTKGCSNAPVAVDSLILQLAPRVALHMGTDACIEVLSFLPRSELEKMMRVSRRWLNVIEGAKASLHQRRSFFVHIKFYGGRFGMLSVHFLRMTGPTQLRILRVLTTRGLSQALAAVHSHLRNAFVIVRPVFLDRVPAPYPPLDMLVNIPLPARVDWLRSLLRSMPSNSEVGSWFVSDAAIGRDNLLTVASCALEEEYRSLACVQELRLSLFNRDATWAQLLRLLNHPTTRAFSGINVGTTKDFLAQRDVKCFIDEFSLLLVRPDSIAFSEMPVVDEATDRRKQFRCHIQGENTVVRVYVYRNRAAREYLTVVKFDHFRRTVLVLKGNVSLADLKSTVHHPYVFY
ncbi:hypothetical protein AAVH_04649 [Aphelenchoides avenae]|nr:hypothetical protein AAVH_04649 [Aphelenchus avenae]